MATYGVPTDLAAALPWSWADERLARSRNYWVVTVDPASRPHATPVWGLWLSEPEQFWFSCAPDALKARNLARNPNVVVMVDDTVEVVSVEGTASPLVADRSMATKYADKYEPDPVKHAQMIDFVMKHAGFLVQPRKAISIIEREQEFAERATRWVW